MKKTTVILASLLALSIATPSFAAEEHGGKHETHADKKDEKHDEKK